VGRTVSTPATLQPELALPTKPLTISAPDAYRLIRGALLWASTDETRPHLNQVYIERDATSAAIASTNGHGMFFADPVAIESAEQFAFGMRSVDALALLRIITDKKEPTKGITETVQFAPLKGDLLRATVGRYSFEFEPIDGFVPYEKVVPAEPRQPHTKVCVQAAYLAKVARTFPGCAKDALRELCLRVGAELDGLRFDGTLGTTRASVVLMPLRCSCG
jgi:hypothetical protein